MTRRALLIGSDYRELNGVRHDLDAMTRALENRGFAVRRCEAPEATRDGILAAYEKLIAEAEPGDAVVVYYSGHGGLTRSDEKSDDGPAGLQFIVPLDFDDAEADGFRGVTAVELSLLQRRLTRITRNVTVILDCCHSGMMSRNATLHTRSRIRAVKAQPYQRVRDHLDRLAAEGLPVHEWNSDGNRYAVRIVACAPPETAAEYESDESGTWIGVLTEALTATLEEVGDDEVTWSTVLDRVRKRVGDLRFPQRPDAEGPSNRLLFSLKEGDLLTSLPVTPAEGVARVRLGCAPLLAVQTGDEFVVMPPGATAVDLDRRIGDLTIDAVGGMIAEGEVRFAAGTGPVPTGARAFRTRVTAPRLRLRIPEPRSDDLVAALDGLVELVDTDWVADIRSDADGALSLYDRAGPLHPPVAHDPDGIAQLRRALKVFGQAHHLRALVKSPSCPLDAPVTIEWGRVADGEARPLAGAGERVTAGERIYVSVRNDGTDAVFVSLIDIGVSGAITVLTRAAPGGRQLRRGESYTFGRNELSGALKGQTLKWPAGFGQEYARDETVLVVVTSERLDLTPLEQPGRTRGRGGLTRSALQDMIDQLGTRRTRDIDPEEEEGVRYDIHAVDFTLAPF